MSLFRTVLLAHFFLFLYFVISVPLKIYHCIITFFRILSRRKFGAQLTAYDAIFAVDNLDHPNAANATLLFFEGAIFLNKVKERFEELLKLDNFSKLRQSMVNFGGYYYWNETIVRIEDHVKLGPRFDPLQDDEDHDEVLHKYLSEEMVAPLNCSRPLWEVTLLPGYKQNGSVLLLRVHHTYADGYSQNYLVDMLLGVKSGYFVKPATIQGWRGYVSLLLRSPGMLNDLYQDALSAPKNIYTSPKSSSSGVISMTTLPLSTYKTIRRKTNTHFASIGMSLMVGALRRFHAESISDLDSYLPKSVGIMHSLPKPGHPLTKLVNHWGVGLFKISTHADPLERLLKTEENFKHYTEQGYDQLLHILMHVLGWAPNFALKPFFNLNFGTGMGFTSVPAFEERVEFDGVRVARMGKVFGFQWGQTAVATAVYTHADLATVTFYANKDIVPDQDSINRVSRYMREEFDELTKQVDNVYKRGLKLG